jgi:DNA repair exonuclease SbcCD ATPase subunit
MDGNHYLDARSYYHNFVEFFQNIKEKTPTSKVTVRELFDDEEDDEVIKQCCEIAGATWVNKLTKVEKEEKVYPDWTIHGLLWKAGVDYFKTRTNVHSFIRKKFGAKVKKDDEQVDVEAGPVESNGQSDESKDEPKDKLKDNPLDQEINERHSGGEKTRLILATRVYRMKKLLKQNRNRVLILDEPEQGSDPPLAYTILDRIKDEFPNLTIIVVSHLERIHEKEWWDKQLSVEDGIVRAMA